MACTGRHLVAGAGAVPSRVLLESFHPVAQARRLLARCPRLCLRLPRAHSLRLQRLFGGLNGGGVGGHGLRAAPCIARLALRRRHRDPRPAELRLKKVNSWSEEGNAWSGEGSSWSEEGNAWSEEGNA
eukprot:5995347-Pyramimonas_sp.AAC.1